MRNMMRMGALLSMIFLLSGCAFTKMETARQLEAGETVVSGSLDWPGFAVIPRAQANGMVGFGRGDVSAHLGTTIASGNLGVSGRFYLSERFNLSLQADIMTLLLDFDLGQGSRRLENFIVTWTPRLTTAVQEGEFLYGGVQANILTGLAPGDSEEPTYQLLGVAGGLLVGVDYFWERSGLGFQVELIVHPMGVAGGGDVVFLGDPETPLLAQLSVGMYFR